MALPDFELEIVGAITDATFMEFRRNFLEQFEKSNKTIRHFHVVLYSPGGEDIAGLAYASFIRQMQFLGARVSITAYGEVNSAAVLILASGTRRCMLAETWVMVHESSDRLKGSVTAMETEIELMRRREKQWCELLAKHTKATPEYWGSIHKETTYLSAEECLELGLVDEII